MSIKFRLGKSDLRGLHADKFPNIVEDAGWNILPSNPVVEASSWRLPQFPDDRDLIDPLLGWQAIYGDYPLISRDRSMKIYATPGLQFCS